MAERVAAAAIVGIALGVLGAHLLFLGWATLIPWGLAGLAVGAICRRRGQALAAGVAYGLVLGFSFMVFGYTGTDPLVGKLPAFAVIGAFSALFGVPLALAGHWLAARGRRGTERAGSA